MGRSVARVGKYTAAMAVFVCAASLSAPVFGMCTVTDIHQRINEILEESLNSDAEKEKIQDYGRSCFWETNVPKCTFKVVVELIVDDGKSVEAIDEICRG